jgi:putative membrane protein
VSAERRFFGILLAILALAFVWSAIYPYDRFTWILEVFPVLIGLPLLALTYRQFPLSHLAYGLLLVHAIILLIGGHYTYAEMPLFSWLRDINGWDRNYYDRVGHVAQGFVPAIIAREILLRTSPLRRGKWLFFLVVCVCLAISAAYEFLEWWVALASGSDAVAFLATQGDVWDTQWDMFLAMLGAVAALLLLSGWHDRSMYKLRVNR